MAASPDTRLATNRKARLKATAAIRQRQNAVRAFNSTVNLIRVCMKTGTDVSDAMELFKAMKSAIEIRDYEDVTVLQQEIFETLRPKMYERRQRARPAFEEPEPEPEPEAAAPVAVPLATPVAEPEPEPEPEPVPEPVPEPKPEKRPKEKMKVERFHIEDVFVVYNDGRLVFHAGETGDGTCEQIRDDHIMSSMLVAIQHFIRDSMGRTGDLGSFEYGENKILIEQGSYIFLAVVLAGKEPPGLRDAMSDVVRRFEGLYAGVVESWDGDTCFFEETNDLISPITTYHQNFVFKEDEEVVRVMSALEFYQGFVRLKVAIKNKQETMISDASLKLTYNKKALYLDRVEPDYSCEGSTVELGVVQPGEKKTVAFYLDPLICMESYIDGTLIYRDYKGNLKTVIMKRRPADIVCPLFYTDTNINTAMLKRLIDEVKYKDTRIYEIPESVDAVLAFDTVKQAVQRHHVRFVREFKEKAPFVGEAWYYGKLQTVGEEMIIRATVRESSRSIEVFVASGNLATLTGLLAELGNDLQALLREHMKSGEKIRRLDDKTVMKEIERSNLLIDKFLDTEAPTESDETEGPATKSTAMPARPPDVRAPKKTEADGEKKDKEDDKPKRLSQKDLLEDILSEIEKGK